MRVQDLELTVEKMKMIARNVEGAEFEMTDESTDPILPAIVYSLSVTADNQHYNFSLTHKLRGGCYNKAGIRAFVLSINLYTHESRTFRSNDFYCFLNGVIRDLKEERAKAHDKDGADFPVWDGEPMPYFVRDRELTSGRMSREYAIITTGVNVEAVVAKGIWTLMTPPATQKFACTSRHQATVTDMGNGVEYSSYDAVDNQYHNIRFENWDFSEWGTHTILGRELDTPFLTLDEWHIMALCEQSRREGRM